MKHPETGRPPNREFTESLAAKAAPAQSGALAGLVACVARAPGLAGMGLIRAYQLTLSGLIGRQCRHMPSCSAYTYETVQRFGLWAGGWMGLARICRCHPWGSHGLDFPPQRPPAHKTWVWWAPWRYGRWRGVQADPDLPGTGERTPPRRAPLRCN